MVAGWLSICVADRERWSVKQIRVSLTFFRREDRLTAWCSDVITDCIDRGQRNSMDSYRIYNKESYKEESRISTGDSSLLKLRVRPRSRKSPSTNRSTNTEAYNRDLRGGIEGGGE